MQGSKSEYARHRGVSPAMVTKWVKSGRIVLDARGALVLFEASDAALAASSNPIHGGQNRGGGRGRPPATTPAPSNPETPGGFIDAKRRQTDAAADLLELRLQRERGELVERSRYDAALVAALSGPLGKLDSLGVRVAPACAADPQVRRIQDIVGDEVARIRQEIADALRALASAGTQASQ